VINVISVLEVLSAPGVGASAFLLLEKPPNILDRVLTRCGSFKSAPVPIPLIDLVAISFLTLPRQSSRLRQISFPPSLLQLSASFAVFLVPLSRQCQTFFAILLVVFAIDGPISLRVVFSSLPHFLGGHARISRPTLSHVPTMILARFLQIFKAITLLAAIAAFLTLWPQSIM
jgi:hypothetical protein